MKYDLDNLPNGISKKSAQHFIDHRKILKKPLTQHALDIAMNHASNAGQIGLTPDQAIDSTIEYGWAAINLKWIDKRLMDDSDAIDRSILYGLTDRSWAE